MAKKKPDRMEKFVSKLLAGGKVYPSAREVGYSEPYSKAGIYTMMRTSRRFEQLVKAGARHNVTLVENMYKANLLPRAYKVDSKILDAQEKDPKLGMQYPKSLDRVHRISGTIVETPPAPSTINIGEIRNLMVTMTEPGAVGSRAREFQEEQRLEKAKQIEGDIVDVEPEDSKDG